MIRAFVLTILSPSLGKMYSRFEAGEDPEDMLAGGRWIVFSRMAIPEIEWMSLKSEAGLFKICSSR